MTPTHLTAVETDGADRVRARLLAALHVSRLRPGDRVPSIRRLAGLAGVNHKTVHRAYTSLARAGILEVRPGSGTFVADRRSAIRGRPVLSSLVDAVDACRREAERLGLEPAALARFFTTCFSGDFGRVTVGVVECNREQIAMIGRDLQRAFGVEVRPLLLGQLEGQATSALAGVDAVITTDCHRSHVVESLEGSSLPVYAVAFDPGFPRRLLGLAAKAEIVMVVHDRKFGPVFLKLLRSLADDSRLLRRIRFVGEGRTRQVLAATHAGTWVYLSPLASTSAGRQIPNHVRKVEDDWHVDPAALESVRVGLALDSVLGAAR